MKPSTTLQTSPKQAMIAADDVQVLSKRDNDDGGRTR
jgi:hypothetical protein